MAARYAELYEQLISGLVPRAAEKLLLIVPDRVPTGQVVRPPSTVAVIVMTP